MPIYAATSPIDSAVHSKSTTQDSAPSSTQVSPGERTAKKREEQEEEEINERQNDSFVQSPSSRREYQDYFSRYPATPQYDHLFLDSEPISPYFRSSPKSPAPVPVHNRTQGNSSRYNIPPPKSSSLPPPKFGMSSSFDNHDVEEDTKAAAEALLSHDVRKGSSPPREKNKVSVVSPPEGDMTRKGKPSTEAPYSPYAYAPVGYPPSPSKSYKHPSSFRSEDAGGGQHPYHHPYYMYPYGPVAGYYYPEDGYYEGRSPNKHVKADTVTNEDAGGDYPPPYRYPPSGPYPYYDRYYHPNYRTSVSDSFDTDERTAHHSEPGKKTPRGPPPISKANSYPPPPSPPRYGYVAEGDASASSYPGSRRVYQNDRSYAKFQHGHLANKDNYEFPPRPYAYYGYGPPPGYYSPHHDYNREEERLAESDRSAGSPTRSTNAQKIQDEKHSMNIDESPATPPPPKSSASSHAQAAIAAGMTEPVSAEEVDFEICNPPLVPVVPPSTTPVLMNNAKISVNDVLCGRGGGTNTQVGNRKYRLLVQEFQPTYLLCRRKEKPLIARTIVLIIRKRGGRFLKKNEEDGGFYEVGDEKAEAKTSQALREGLDVRASKISIDGKKRPRTPKKKKEDKVLLSPEGTRDVPPHLDTYGYPYPPPPHAYYPYPYGADPYYGPPPVPYGYPSPPGQYTPSRKRPRQPSTSDEGQDPHHYTYPYKVGYPYPPYTNVPPPNHDQYGPRPGQDESGREEENPMWEMDFSPPRTSIPREQGEH